jgi:hypothetical protein
MIVFSTLMRIPGKTMNMDTLRLWTMPEPMNINLADLHHRTFLQIAITESTQACRWVAHRSVRDRVADEVFIALSKGTVLENVPLSFEKLSEDILYLKGCGAWCLIEGTPPVKMRHWQTGWQFRGHVYAREHKLQLTLARGLKLQMIDLPYMRLPFRVQSCL